MGWASGIVMASGEWRSGDCFAPFHDVEGVPCDLDGPATGAEGVVEKCRGGDLLRERIALEAVELRGDRFSGNERGVDGLFSV